MKPAALSELLQRLTSHPPSFAYDERRAECFAGIAAFLESSIRPGHAFDLKTARPNPVWQLFEETLDQALTDWMTTRPERGRMAVQQWYSSGVLLDTGSTVLGFDVIPMRRIYGWEDRFDLTGRLAKTLDALFITHRHEDHCDAELVAACIREGTPVYMPEPLAIAWDNPDGIIPIGPNYQGTCAGVEVHGRPGTHVWRETPEELPLTLYELIWPSGVSLIYGGDVDYTQPLMQTDGTQLKVFFVPWRAPNAAYEPGHAQQTGILLDAVHVLLDQLAPAVLIYEHCAELEHIYDGFTCSFDMALNLQRELAIPSELLFWGERVWLDQQLNPVT